MKKPPVYYPLAMASQTFANKYGKACQKYDKAIRKKELELNRDRLSAKK